MAIGGFFASPGGHDGEGSGRRDGRREGPKIKGAGGPHGAPSIPIVKSIFLKRNIILGT